MTVRRTIVIALFDKLVALIGSETGATSIAEVIEYDVKRIKSRAYKTPVIVLTDSGTEELVLSSGGKDRFVTSVIVGAEVADFDGPRLAEMLDDITAEVKRLIIAGVDLGDNCLNVRWVGVESRAFSAELGLAATQMKVEITYWCTRGSY